MKKKIALMIFIAAFLLGGCGTLLDNPLETVIEVVGGALADNTAEIDNEEAEADDGIGGLKGIFQDDEDLTSGVEYETEKLQHTQEEVAKLYYYAALSQEEKHIYAQIYLSLLNREEVIVATRDVELLDRVYQCVMNDHPEIFYSSGYVCTKHMLGDTIQELTFLGRYDMTPEEEASNQQEIDTSVQQCFEAMPQGLDQYGQVKYIYDYLIENTQYNLGAANNQNICSVFLGHESVCQGYAKATQYLLRQLGYEITLVSGEAEGGNHAWNLIMVDGAYYYLDTTWGDVDYQTQEEDGSIQKPQTMPVNYDYFLITTAQLEKTHVIKSVEPMPACVTEANNYYVREGLYFTEWNEAQLQGIFDNAYETGEEIVTIKAADETIFYTLKDTLLEQQKIFDFVNQTEKVTYYEDSDMGTIYFWLER